MHFGLGLGLVSYGLGLGLGLATAGLDYIPGRDYSHYRNRSYWPRGSRGVA